MVPNRQGRKPRENGYIIYEDQRYVVITTGFIRKSKNDKTGDMLQSFILDKTVNPNVAVKTGQDKAVCFDCPCRPSDPIHDPQSAVYDPDAPECYVIVYQAPTSVWKKFKRGGYARLVDGSL